MPPEYPEQQPEPYNWLRILLIIVGVLIITGGIYFYLQHSLKITTPELIHEQGIDTANWQTYRNEEYGYEIKYPSNLELWGSISNEALDYKPRYPASTKDSIVFTKDGPLRVEAYFGKVEWEAKNEMSLSFIATTTLNGYQASKGRRCELGGCMEQIIIERGHLTYELNLEQSSLNNQILSTFKFINTQSVASSSISVPELYSAVKWREVPFEAVRPAEFQIYYNNFKYSQRENNKDNSTQPHGRLWVSTNRHSSESELYDMRKRFNAHYYDAFANSGWALEQDSESKQISFHGIVADGPLSNILGYVKIQDNKIRLIGLSYEISNFTTISGEYEPIQIACPCDLNLKVFVSDEVNLDTITF
jgi:hypothetical protein